MAQIVGDVQRRVQSRERTEQCSCGAACGGGDDLVVVCSGGVQVDCSNVG